MRQSLSLGFLAALALAASARAQGGFVDSSVAGAELVGSYFAAEFHAPPGQSWSVEEHLVNVYRATIEQGTLVLSATVPAGTAPRTFVSQTLSIVPTAGTVAQDSDTGPPSETLAASVDVPWNKSTTIFSYPLFLSYDVVVSGVSASCGGNLGCAIRYTDIVLPSRAAITIGGIERPRPALLIRNGARHIDLASAGLSPFAEWASIAIDGEVLAKYPFLDGYATPPMNQWYRHPLRAGDAAKSGDPLAPSELVIPSEHGSIEDFLSCGGGGCGTHQARIGLGDRTMVTGLHTITLTTRPFVGGTYQFFGQAAEVGAGIADDAGQFTTQFILFDPEAVAPTEGGPGQTIEVRGSGFAPNSNVRVQAHLFQVSRRTQIGAAATDVTGSFVTQVTLPSAGDAFFAELIRDGTAKTGAIQVDIDDPAFITNYFGGVPQSDDAPFTFLPTAATPTTTTTSTTLPGGGPEPPPEGLDVPACSATPVPTKAQDKFASGEQLLSDVEQLILEQAARKKVRKLLGKADGALIATRRLVNRARKKGLIPEGCSAAAVDVIEDVRARVQEIRDGLKR